MTNHRAFLSLKYTKTQHVCDVSISIPCSNPPDLFGKYVMYYIKLDNKTFFLYRMLLYGEFVNIEQQ
jgi:hypothetical protein